MASTSSRSKAEITQSIVHSLLSMITVRLNDHNFIKWSFLFQSAVEGNDLFEYFDGSLKAPPKFVLITEGEITSEITQSYKDWKRIDKALMTLLMATLENDIMDIIVGCKSSEEAWKALQDRFSSVSRVNIMQMKTDLQTIKKGSDTIEKYLQRVKCARDHLLSVGVSISDEDIIIVILAGLTDEYSTIKMIVQGRDNPISLKDLRSQLLSAEKSIEGSFSTYHQMAAMAARTENSNSGTNNIHTVDHMMAMTARNNVPGYHTNRGGLRNENNNAARPGQQSFGSSSSGYSSQCEVCGKRGHNVANCYTANECSICGKHGHFASTCYHNPVNFANSTSNNGASSNAVYGSRTGPTPECQICSKRGHTTANCYYRNETSSASSSRNIVTCQICGVKGHVALDCVNRSNYSFQGKEPAPNLMAMTAQNTGSVTGDNNGASSSTALSSPEMWLGDSGATHHMTADFRNLTVAQPYSSGQNISGDSVQRQE